jgi:hypothetical protein
MFKQKARGTVWRSPNLEPLQRIPRLYPGCHTCGTQVSFTASMTQKRSLSSINEPKDLVHMGPVGG